MTQTVEEKMYQMMIDGLMTEDKTDDQLYAEFIDDDPVRWITNNFYIPETKQPIELYPSQTIPLRRALEKDENGLFIYSTIVWGAVKKSAKSTIAGAVCLYLMWQKGYSTAKLYGNDQKQADSRIFNAIKIAIELHPRMKDLCRVINHKIILPNKSVIEAVPVDPEGEAGAGDDFVSYTEIWGWKNKAALKAWTESTLSPLKYGKSLRWCDSYAGENGEAPVLEQLYQNLVKDGKCINQEYEMYENRAFRLGGIWQTRPYLPWQTQEYLSQEAATLTDSEFRRVHKNEWVSSTQQFVPDEWWLSCQQPFDKIPDDDPMVIALDAAIESDCFALVGVGGFSNDKIAVRIARAWYPPKGDKIRYQLPDGSGPEDELRRLIDRYNVIEVCYDPYQLGDLASRFETDMLANMYKFGQQGPRLIADKQLHDMIRDRKIYHSGEPDLKEHIQNANRKSEGDKLRIVKRSEHMKIDLAVALSMAVDRARSWNL